VFFRYQQIFRVQVFFLGQQGHRPLVMGTEIVQFFPRGENQRNMVGLSQPDYFRNPVNGLFLFE